MTFPEFTEPAPIGGLRSWTARFESWNQRTDDVYYLVTVHEGSRPVARFMAQVWLPPGEADPAAELHRQVHRIAGTGETNTAYLGPVLRRDGGDP